MTLPKLILFVPQRIDKHGFIVLLLNLWKEKILYFCENSSAIPQTSADEDEIIQKIYSFQENRSKFKLQGEIIMAAHKGAEHHHKAAEHHEHAAKHHREAATHHEAGNHEKGGHHAHIAHGHHTHAKHHADEAAKHHANEHGGGKK